MAVIERLKKLAESDKWRRIIIGAAVALMLLLLLSSVSCNGIGGSSSEKKQDSVIQENFSDLEKDLERRLELLISEIDGAGKVSVMVTLDTSSRLVYDKNVRTDGSLESTPDGFSETHEKQTDVVLAGSSKEPLRIGTVQPQVRGAAVVCSGASDPVIQARVANLVANALGIGISRVYVTC